MPYFLLRSISILPLSIAFPYSMFSPVFSKKLHSGMKKNLILYRKQVCLLLTMINRLHFDMVSLLLIIFFCTLQPKNPIYWGTANIKPLLCFVFYITLRVVSLDCNNQSISVIKGRPGFNETTPWALINFFKKKQRGQYLF